MSVVKHIFVYGTLRKGHHASQTFGLKNYIGTFEYKGAYMFSLGGFPGIKLTTDEQSIIIGDVFELEDDKQLDLLDGYEGFDPYSPNRSLYIRKEIEVNGIPCYVYEYNGTPRDTIESGNWESVSRIHRRSEA